MSDAAAAQPRVTPLTDPDTAAGHRRLAWLAEGEDGVPLGSAFLRLFTGAGQLHLAEVDVRVHPAERRAGVGSLLLDEAVAAARMEGRTALLAQAPADSPGAAFLTARGFRTALTLTYTRLALAEADLPALAAVLGAPHPGYRLVSWEGEVPEDLAD